MSETREAQAYEVVYGTIEEVLKQVNKLIQHNYKPHGSLVYVETTAGSPVFYQPMFNPNVTSG